jgi:hypothetical protein
LLQLSNPRRARTRPEECERPEHGRLQIRKKGERLEEFSAADLRCPVVNPDPEPILDPLQVRDGIVGHSFAERPRESAVSLPENRRIFDPLGDVGERDEFQIHVERRSTVVQADQEPRLADVLSRERGQERAERARDPIVVIQDRCQVCRIDGDDEIEIAVLVHRVGEKRSAGCDPGDPSVELQSV